MTVDRKTALAVAASLALHALVATAVGLLVAIPAVMAFNAFQKAIDRSIGSTEVVARLVISHSRGRRS